MKRACHASEWHSERVDNPHDLAAVQWILEQARTLTNPELHTPRREVQSVVGFFGLKRSGREASEAAAKAAEHAGRTGRLSALVDQTFIVVLETAADSATGNGRDVEDARRQAAEFSRSATVDHSTGARRRLERSIGRQEVLVVALAADGVNSAAKAALLWDLAEEDGEFTPSHRSLLMRPWLTVRSLPPSLLDG